MCGGARPARSRRCAGRIMSATFEPRLPFDDEEVRLKADATAGGIRLQPDLGATGGVRLQPDHSGSPSTEPDLADADARRAAVDPSQNIVLEASAGTGKTRVLVERYVNLLRAGIEPDHILAITFTRKAAAEMRQRIIDRLKEASRLSEFDAGRWRELRERLGDIAISTIDAFCLSLLREFALEADVDPGFDLAADTDIPRLIAESLDQALRICRGVAREDDDVALVFAQLGERRLRVGIAALLDRRLVAPHALRRFLQSGPRDLTGAKACELAAARLRDVFSSVRDGLDVFLDDGPIHQPQFAMLAADIRHLWAQSAIRNESAIRNPQSARETFRSFIDRLRAYFLTQDGKPRGEKFTGTPFKATDCDTEDAWRRHRASAAQLAPLVADVIRGFRRDLNVVLSRGVWRIFAVALSQYQRTLDAHALVDFSGVLERAVKLLKDLDEFAASRLRLEARYRHVLVDEFQDTSRAQLELVRQVVRSWGEGFGAADDAIAPSIFIVGDRKQSIYGFRDADVALVDEAAQFIEGLRPDGRPRHAISVSFRSAPEILAFVNDVFGEIVRDGSTDVRKDAFRYAEQDRFPVDTAVRLKPDATETEMVRLQPDHALGIIAAETVQATADRVAATLLRSRLVRISDEAVARLAPNLAAAILKSGEGPAFLGDEDRRVLDLLRAAVPRWLSWVDRLPPSELFDAVLRETAYAYELRGSRRRQARENLKKLRAMIRRAQNRGYATLARIADHLERLAVGDESNAAIDAIDAVSLMTVHAAKGLEFPIVFVVNMGRGTAGGRAPIRIANDAAGGPSGAIAHYQSGAGAGAAGREKGESERVLYVALTRARDRLYLSAMVP